MPSDRVTVCSPIQDSIEMEGNPLGFFLSGIISGQAGVSGALNLNIPLAGVIAGQASGTGALTVTSGFDLATLDLAAWLQPAYSGSPWVGNASTGTSGANDATEGTNAPTTGANLNSRATASFDGTNDLLTLDGNADTYMTSTAFGGGILFKANTAGAADGTNPYTEDQLLSTSANGVFGISFSTSGVRAWFLNPAFGYTTLVIACATGSWHFVQWRYDGTNLELRLDNGSWSSVAVGNAAWASFPLSGQVLELGNGIAGSGGFYDGLMAEVLLAKRKPDDTEFDNWRTAVNAYNGTSI